MLSVPASSTVDNIQHKERVQRWVRTQELLQAPTFGTSTLHACLRLLRVLRQVLNRGRVSRDAETHGRGSLDRRMPCLSPVTFAERTRL